MSTISHRSRLRIVLGVGIGVLAGATVALLVMLMFGTLHPDTRGTGESPTIPAPVSGSEPEALVSTATGDQQLAAVPIATAAASDSDDLDIRIDPTVRRQRVEGFGAAMTHSSAQLLMALPESTRAELLDELFGTQGELRLSVLRIPIGSSDFTPTEPFTFNDLPRGETDWELSRFDLSPDRMSLIPVLQEILQINPDIRIVASPWSPPAWLKTPAELEGGRLIDEDRVYETYADYLTRFITEYRDEGISIDYLTVQNEPQLRHPDGYPATDLPVRQAAKLIEHLGPRLRDAGLHTSILGYDHNWELNPADAATTPDGEDPAYRYPADLLRTSASRWIAGTAFHCYYGDATSQAKLLAEFPEQEIWVTECSGSSSPSDSVEKAYSDTLGWQASNLLIPSLENGASAVLTWNLALDEDHGPHNGGCNSCSGVVTLAGDGEVIRNAEYALLGQASRFLPPGSIRMGTSGGPEHPHVAFRTPDHRTVLLIWNPTDAVQDLTVGDGTTSASVQLPARSLATIAWGGTAAP